MMLSVTKRHWRRRKVKKEFKGKKQIYLRNILYMYGNNANQEFFPKLFLYNFSEFQSVKRTKR